MESLHCVTTHNCPFASLYLVLTYTYFDIRHFCPPTHGREELQNAADCRISSYYYPDVRYSIICTCRNIYTTSATTNLTMTWPNTQFHTYVVAFFHKKKSHVSSKSVQCRRHALNLKSSHSSWKMLYTAI